MTGLRVIHTVAGIDPGDGGPSRTVTGLCAALAERGLHVELLTGGDGDLPDDGGFTLRTAPTYSLAGRRFPRPGAFARLLEERLGAGGPAVVHDHGLWLPSNHTVARTATRLGVPRVVSPRGMLSDWSLRYRRGRKRILWRLFQRRDLRRADLMHATSDAEAGEIRAAGLDGPIAVVPNGVALPPEGPRPPRGRARRALFLSRVHPKKGLEELVDAWGRVRPEGWELVIAGPDEGGHRGRIERRVAEAGLGDTITFAGPVTDAAKWDLYRGSDLFVLPSHSENFGVVILEALSAGLPVITTRLAPWAELEEERCGWWIQPEVKDLARALREAVRLGDQERGEMGERGRALAAERYGWEAVAERMESAYRWIAGIGDRPEWIA